MSSSIFYLGMAIFHSLFLSLSFPLVLISQFFWNWTVEVGAPGLGQCHLLTLSLCE